MMESKLIVRRVATSNNKINDLNELQLDTSSLTKTVANYEIEGRQGSIYDPLDIAEISGMSKPEMNANIKKFDNDEIISGYYNGKHKQFLTRHGLYRVLNIAKGSVASIYRKLMYKLIDDAYDTGTANLNVAQNFIASEHSYLLLKASKDFHNAIKKIKERHLKEIELTDKRIKNIINAKDDALDEIHVLKKRLHEERLKQYKPIPAIYNDNANYKENLLNYLQEKYMKQIIIVSLYGDEEQDSWLDIDPTETYQLVFNLKKGSKNQYTMVAKYHTFTANDRKAIIDQLSEFAVYSNGRAKTPKILYYETSLDLIQAIVEEYNTNIISN